MKKILWAVMAFLSLAIAAYAWVSVASPDSRAPFVADLFSEKALRTAGHLGAGGIALVTGALQFNTGLRQRRPRAHRSFWLRLPGCILGRIGLSRICSCPRRGVRAASQMDDPKFCLMPGGGNAAYLHPCVLDIRSDIRRGLSVDRLALLGAKPCRRRVVHHSQLPGPDFTCGLGVSFGAVSPLPFTLNVAERKGPSAK